MSEPSEAAQILALRLAENDPSVSDNNFVRLVNSYLNDIQAAIDQALAESLAREARLREFIEGMICPHCGGQGWYVQTNYHTGEPEQEQCRWCDEKATVLFDPSPAEELLRDKP